MLKQVIAITLLASLGFATPAGASECDGGSSVIDVCGVCGGDGIPLGACNCDGDPLGDTNGDGTLNITDVLQGVDCILGIESPCSLCNDVNADGDVTVQDIIMVVNAIVNTQYCTCTHGHAATFIACPATGTELCVSCAEGYVLSDNATPICTPNQVSGCQDSGACNFNLQANTDSGDCVYAQGSCESCSGQNDGTGTVIVSATGTCAWDFSGKMWGSFANHIRHESTNVTSDKNPDLDVDLTLTALHDTHQTMYGLGFHNPWSYGNLLAFLAHEQSQDLKLFADLGARHLGSENMWLPDGKFKYTRKGDCSSFDGPTAETWESPADGSSSSEVVCYEKYSNTEREDFLYAFQNAASTLSILSNTYPQLEGLDMDDFDSYVCGPEHNLPYPGSGRFDDYGHRIEYCYTEADVQSIVDAAKHCDGCNPDFKVWPTVYFKNGIPRLIGDAHVLGQKEILGNPMHEGEKVYMELSFVLSALPESATLSFLVNDTYPDSSESHQNKLFRYVQVNALSSAAGETMNPQGLFETDISGNFGVELFSQDIAPFLQIGSNTIQIGLHKKGAASFLKKIIYVWDLGLSVDGVEFSDYDLAYHATNSLGIDQQHKAWRYFVAEQSQTNISQIVDGVIAPNLIPSVHYDDEVYAHVLQRTQRYLPESSDFITVAYGQRHGKEILTESRLSEVLTALAHSDRVLVWQLPMPIHYLSEKEGIFQNTDGYTGNWDAMSFWPYHEACIEGWWEEWQATIEDSHSLEAGNHLFYLYIEEFDAFNRAEYPGTFFRTTIQVEGQDGYLFDSNTDAGKTDFVSVDPIPVLLSSLPVKLTMRVENIADCGNVTNKVKMRFRNTSNPADPGFGEPLVNWTHSTGISQAEIPKLYCDVTQAMHERLAAPDSPAWPPVSLDECLEISD